MTAWLLTLRSNANRLRAALVPLPQERLRAKEIHSLHERASLDLFKLWPDKSYFFNSRGDCLIAYSVDANLAIALGDPVGPEEEIAATVAGFRRYCEFVKLMLRCNEEGLTRFNLGMAPMAGFREREDACAAERAVHLFFQRFNFLFSFGGIKRYKAKFATDWEPCYAIFRSALDLPKLGIALNKVSKLNEQPIYFYDIDWNG